MAVSQKWFDYATYMANKLAQMKALEPNAGWNDTKLTAAFESAGFKGDEGAYKHFQKYGHKTSRGTHRYFYFQSSSI